MAKKAGGNADTNDDATTDRDEPADEGKGDKPVKGKADKPDDPNEKKFTQSDLDAALAQDRLDRKKSAPTKPNTSTAKKKEKAESDDDGDTEKERRRADDAEDRLRAREARDTVEDAAREAGFSNPNKIYRLIKDDLTFDDSGKPDNVKDLITIAKRNYKEELGGDKKPPGSADGGAKGGAGVKSSMNDFLRRGAGIT